MINFRNRDDLLPSSLIVASIVVLLSTLAFMLLVAPPSAKGVVAGRARSRASLQDNINQAKESSRIAEEAIKPRLWTGEIESVTAAALSRLTASAQTGKLTLAAFRPQKPRTIETLTELAFSVQVTGPYPEVLDFVRRIDRPETRLVLRSFQAASADAATDAVTATVGLVAYVAPAPKTSAARVAGRTGGN